MRNVLAIANISPDLFAYKLMKGPGYLAMVAGEVIHIIKCIPNEVKIQHSDNCYTELRVSHNNKTYFLTPKTHILKTQGTIINCNPLIASQYRIDQIWYRMLQKPTGVQDPEVIKPLS